MMQLRHERFVPIRPERVPVGKSVARDRFTGDEKDGSHG
jgi:hypothetical protein